MSTPASAVRVRYYSLAMPTDTPTAGFDYLEAIAQDSIPVKACPIGPIFIAGRWPELMHCFMAPMPEQRFVNVVCAPLDLKLGFEMTKASAGPSPGIVPGVAPRENDVIYAPKTAIGGLYTLGVPNVAITSARRDRRPSAGELAVLSKYDLVAVPTEDDADALIDFGVSSVMTIPARDFPRALKTVLATL